MRMLVVARWGITIIVDWGWHNQGVDVLQSGGRWLAVSSLTRLADVDVDVLRQLLEAQQSPGFTSLKFKNPIPESQL